MDNYEFYEKIESIDKIKDYINNNSEEIKSKTKDLYEYVKNGNISINEFKTRLVEIFNLEIKKINKTLSYNEEYNSEDIYICFVSSNTIHEKDNIALIYDDTDEFKSFKTDKLDRRLDTLKHIIKELYKEISRIRKLILIKNHISPYTRLLTINYIVNNNFDINKNNIYKIENILKQNTKYFNIYPVLSYEYNSSLERKKLNELYSDYINKIELLTNVKEINNIKETYFEIINTEVLFDKDYNSLIEENNSIEIYNFFNELIKYNDKHKYDNSYINNILKVIKSKIDPKGTNIYQTIYGE